MSSFSDAKLVLHVEGDAASAVALVGSAFSIPLIYAGPDGIGRNLTGWRLDAKAELYPSGTFAEDGRLTHLVGPPITQGVGINDGTIAIPAVMNPDQAGSPGAFVLSFHAGLPPQERNVPIDAPTLPTLAVWVSFMAPGGGLVDQMRVAVGYRRGIASLGP